MATNRRTGGVPAGLLALTIGAAMGLSWTPEVATADLAPESAVEGDHSIDLEQIKKMMEAKMGDAKNGKKKKGPSWKDVSKGFEKVETGDNGTLYGIWVNKKESQVLAELPGGFGSQKHFFAMTVAGGETFAGLQAGDRYVQWKKINDRMALVMPQIEIRSTGDQESKDSVKMIFTDRVLLDVAIVCDGPSGRPVIDLDDLLVGQAKKFFGWKASGLNKSLTTITKVKSFPKNVEIEFTGPVAGGTMKSFHYSISKIQGTAGFKPRKADQRVGYFTTSWQDLGKFDWKDTNIRYINRWHIEKRDKKLRLSPPKEPIVYYVEHTVPVRYRRWVKQGAEYWNKAFREIGIDGAIEIRFQDKASGSHMDKDPEDVRYNFIRWLSNDVATAIGPSRVNPMTGEILDADVVLTDGWIRVFTYRWEDLLPELATEGMGPEALAWLSEHPRWDPRLRLATPEKRREILHERSLRKMQMQNYSEHPIHTVDQATLGDDEYDGLVGRSSQVCGSCNASRGKALGLATMRMYLDAFEAIEGAAAERAEASAKGDDEPEVDEEMLDMLRKQLEENPQFAAFIPEKYKALLEGGDDEDEGADEEEDADEEDEDNGKDDEDDVQKLDGIPEWFIGPALAELVCHEVGHTLGLRHNFKGSTFYSLDDINSEDIKDNAPWSMSVMDYNGVNIRMPGHGEEQGNFSVIDIGPYDMWAIEYGYTFGKPEEVAKRAAEPELQYGTDEDTYGPDPTTRRYDLSADPLDFAQNTMDLVRELRKTMLEHFVEDGDSWSRARRGYRITLGQQMQSLSMMANWVGSARVYRDKKGDPDGRAPIDVVDAEVQRAALAFCMDNAFEDEAFGLTPEILAHMTVDKWWDMGGIRDVVRDPTYEIHNKVLGIQSATLTMLLNPQTLRRVHDLEHFVPVDEDALTLAEVMDSVTGAIWGELDAKGGKKFTARKPMISSFRRNLQREHVERLIDLSMSNSGYDASEKPVKTLATQALRDLDEQIGGVLESGKADAYTKAHLGEAQLRIAKALDAQYIYDVHNLDLGGGMPRFFFQEQGEQGE